MEVEKVLARLFVHVKFSEASLRWLAKAREHQLWLAEEDGRHFFSQFHATWEKTLIEACEPLILDFFRELGCSVDSLPQLKVVEAYPGSWNMEAVIKMRRVNSNVQNNVSMNRGSSDFDFDLPRLQSQLDESFSELINQRVRERLDFPTAARLLPPPPEMPLVVTLRVDPAVPLPVN